MDEYYQVAGEKCFLSLLCALYAEKGQERLSVSVLRHATNRPRIRQDVATPLEVAFALRRRMVLGTAGNRFSADAMRQPIFREIEHTADKALEIRGEDLPHLFESAAYGMFDVMVDLNTVTPERDWHVELEAQSLEDLFTAWLRELIYLSDVDEAIPCQFDVKEVAEWRVRADVRGGRLGPRVVRKGAQVKAVTYHNLVVQRDADGWRARVTFDV